LASERVVRVKSWSELPETLEPGVYEVDGARLEIREPLERDEARELVRLVKRVDRKYYG